MSNEQERLRRLRESQLKDRDPHVKTRKFQHESADKERRMAKGYSLGEAWGVLPNAWKSIVFSLVAGVLAVLIVPQFWDSEWALFTVGFGTLIVLVIGILIGRAMDARDEIRRQL